MFKKLRAWLGCLHGHEWWLRRDYNRMYHNIGLYYILRTCKHCGKTQVAMPKMGAKIVFDDMGLPDLDGFFWVKMSEVYKEQ